VQEMEILRIINRKYAEGNLHEDRTLYTIGIDSSEIRVAQGFLVLTELEGINYAKSGAILTLRMR
jgi:hypothetical protein